MTKYEMGLKLAKLNEENLVLKAKLSQVEQVMRLAEEEVEKGQLQNAKRLLQLHRMK